ncbi:MAG: hypothetical protein NVSMB2_08050 [Chloroflexota bacterium]
MTSLLAFSIVGAGLALVRGGALARWSTVQVYGWAFALGSLAVQLVLHNPPIDRQPWALTLGPLIWMMCLLALVIVLAFNAVRQPAMRAAWGIAAIGVGLNLAVVAANGGFMPQSADARSASRGGPLVETDGRLHNVIAMTDGTRLNVLGDALPEPAWLPNANVVSVGDLLLGLGLALWVYGVTRTRGTPIRRGAADA